MRLWNILIYSILIFYALIFFVFLLLPLGPGSSDFSKYIQDGFKLTRMSGNYIYIAREVWREGSVCVPPKVLRLNDYEDYIISERIGLKKVPDRPGGVPDSTLIDYWILNTEEEWVLGNLTSDEFQQKRDSLGIPPSVQLMNINEYRLNFLPFSLYEMLR